MLANGADICSIFSSFAVSARSRSTPCWNSGERRSAGVMCVGSSGWKDRRNSAWLSMARADQLAQQFQVLRVRAEEPGFRDAAAGALQPERRPQLLVPRRPGMGAAPGERDRGFGGRLLDREGQGGKAPERGGAVEDEDAARSGVRPSP